MTLTYPALGLFTLGPFSLEGFLSPWYISLTTSNSQPLGDVMALGNDRLLGEDIRVRRRLPSYIAEHWSLECYTGQDNRS